MMKIHGTVALLVFAGLPVSTNAIFNCFGFFFSEGYSIALQCFFLLPFEPLVSSKLNAVCDAGSLAIGSDTTTCGPCYRSFNRGNTFSDYLALDLTVALQQRCDRRQVCFTDTTCLEGSSSFTLVTNAGVFSEPKLSTLYTYVGGTYGVSGTRCSIRIDAEFEDGSDIGDTLEMTSCSVTSNCYASCSCDASACPGMTAKVSCGPINTRDNCVNPFGGI